MPQRIPITKKFILWTPAFEVVTVVGAVAFSSSEIGDTDLVTIEVIFNQNVSATDFTAGVTIKKNTVAQTIVSGTLQIDERIVFYVVDTAADINDVLTWEYDSGPGTIVGLGDVSAQTVTNYIGSHLYFDTADDSAHLLSVGV